MFISDVDQQITNATNQFIVLKLLNPKTRYRGCYWHGVTQVLLKTFSKENEKARMVRDVLICFMGMCSKSQTEIELKYYWNEMINWINDMKKQRNVRRNAPFSY